MAELLHYIISFRVVAIRGEMGFGKTLLAFILAKRLLEDGYVDGVVSNVPNIFPAQIWVDDGSLLNKCMIFDEAGLLGLDSRTSMANSNDYGAFARKFGAIFLFSSVIPVDKRVRGVEIYPIDKNRITGATKWAYEFAGDKDGRVRYVSVNPKEGYGLYSTSYIPSDDRGMADRFRLSVAIKTGIIKNDEQERQQKMLLEAAGMMVDAD